MKLSANDLEQITALTLRHYNDSADGFREATRDHDVSQNIAALLRHIEGTPPFNILEFGCGPGRDLKTLHALGHSLPSAWTVRSASSRWHEPTRHARSGNRTS